MFAKLFFLNLASQVETFGTMEKKEKVEFILEQMRLCFETKDYIRTQIISKKISIKYFEGADTEGLKLRYYRQMIDLNLHHKEYLAVSKNYHEIYNTASVKEEEQKWKQVSFHSYLLTFLAISISYELLHFTFTGNIHAFWSLDYHFCHHTSRFEVGNFFFFHNIGC